MSNPRVTVNERLAEAIEQRDWSEVEAIALELLAQAPFNDAGSAAWAMVAIVAAKSAPKAPKAKKL